MFRALPILLALLLLGVPTAHGTQTGPQPRDEFIREILAGFWGNARNARGEPIHPETEQDRATVPVPVAVAYWALDAGEVSGRAEWCGLEWEPHYFALTRAARQARLVDTQVAFVSVLHGAAQGRFLDEMAGTGCSSAERVDAEAAMVESGKAEFPAPHSEPQFRGVAQRIECPAATATDYYFAPGAFVPRVDVNESFVREWYTSQLRAMDEPSLSCNTTGAVYRFTWLRTFHPAVAVRIVDSGKGGTLDAVELTGQGGYAPGKVRRRAHIALSPAAMSALRIALSPLWQWPAFEHSNGRDGSEWIVEMTDGRQYHALTRWTPRSGAVHEVGALFLRLSGWTFAEDETY